MYKLGIICTLVVITGCAQQTLKEAEYVGGGWMKIAVNEDSAVSLQTVKEAPVRITKTGKATHELMKWSVRLVNPSQRHVCVNPQLSTIDVQSRIQKGWYQMAPHSTSYLGTLVQQPWVLTERIMVLEDAMWTVSSLKVVPFQPGVGCSFKKERK